MTPPSRLQVAIVRPADVTLRGVEADILYYAPGKTVDDAIKRGEACVRHAWDKGARGEEFARLEARLESLKRLAESRLRDNVISPAVPRGRHERSLSVKQARADFDQGAAKRNAPTVIDALKSPHHWRSKDYHKHLVSIIEGNDVLPNEYKQQLPKDVADVLRACPHAGGLVKELTLRGQRGATGSVSKLGSRGNSAVGSAYELMGTAVLTRMVSTPSNGGPRLHIQTGIDKVTFGVKSNINRQLGPDSKTVDMPTRRSIECDVRVGRNVGVIGYREIGIDFKHVKDAGVRSSSEAHENQVANVVKAIQQGHIDEYHFVTNGTFGTTFKGVVDKANETLSAGGNSIIAYHERVRSV